MAEVGGWYSAHSADRRRTVRHSTPTETLFSIFPPSAATVARVWGLDDTRVSHVSFLGGGHHGSGQCMHRDAPVQGGEKDRSFRSVLRPLVRPGLAASLIHPERGMASLAVKCFQLEEAASSIQEQWSVHNNCVDGETAVDPSPFAPC